MRRTASAIVLRLAALVVAVLLSATTAMAAPTSGAPTPVRDSAAAPKSPNYAPTQRVVRSRGAVNLTELAKKPNKTRPTVKLPFLTPRSTTDGGATSRAASGIGPLVPSQFTGKNARDGIEESTLPGLSQIGTIEPPDPFVAVGPDHVVETVNLQIRVQRRQGEQAATENLADFFELPAGIFNADPRVIYDSLHARWIVTELEWDCVPGPGAGIGHGYIDIAVSTTPDPTGDWRSWYITFDDVLPDYPGVGTSTDKIAIGSNLFGIGAVCSGGAGSFLGTEIDFLDFGQLVNGNLEPTVRAVISDTTDELSTPRPAVQSPATSAAIFVVVAMANDTPASVGLATFTGSVPAGTPSSPGVADLTASAGFDGFGNPPSPKEPGGGVVTADIDGRPTDAVYQGGRLGFVATTGCNPSGDTTTIQDCVRVGEINTTLLTQRQDFLVGETGRDYYFGGIGYSLNGSLHVTYTASSTAAGDYASGYAVYQLASDALNSVSDPAEKVVSGTGLYAHPGSRWGDYLGVGTDPQAPGAVWRVNQAAGTGTWFTNVGMLNTDAGATYHPIAPQRVLDTRSGIGLTNRFVANSPRTFQIRGRGTVPNSIPPTAVAITGNVTVTQQTASGYVAVTPRPTNSPRTSTLNFPVADNRANNVTLPLGPNGTIAAVYKSSSGQRTHLIFDVTGYFVPGSAESGYTTLTPVRILDTRSGTGLAGKFRAGIPRAFQIRNAGGVPNDPTVVAVTGNITVTRQTSGGFIALTPTNSGIPSTSNLNFPVGDNRANGVSVRLGDDGRLWAVYGGAPGGATTDLVFDVTGYYKTGGSGLKFYALNPGRIMDTRGAPLSGLSGPFDGTGSPALNTRNLDTAGHQGVPPVAAGAAAVTGNFTVTGATRPGFFSIRKAASDAETSTINFPAGDNRANGVTVPLNADGDLVLRYNASGGTSHAILDISGYFAP